MNSGLELKVGPDSLIKCDDLSKLSEDKGRLEARQHYATKIPPMLETALKAYSRGTDEHTALTEALAAYEKGSKIGIEGCCFYDPEKGNGDNHKFLMNPGLNTASNTASLAHVPARLAGFLRFAKIPGLSKIFLPLSYSMKFLNKAYKEARKPNPDFKKIAKYGIAGIGGTLIFLPTTLGEGALFFSVYLPLTAFFNLALTTPSLKDFFKGGGAPVEGDLPAKAAIRKDLEEQVERCKELERKYPGQLKVLKEKKEIIDEVIKVNKYLKHHITNIRIRDVDIEIDAFRSDLLGSSPRADTITGTAEFAASQLQNITPPVFARAYSMQVFQLDGTANAGVASFKADRLLEDMAAYNPGCGYEKVMEGERLSAITRIYAMKRKEDLVQQLIMQHEKEEDLKKAIMEELKDELSGLGVDPERLEKLEKGLFPSENRVVAKVKSFLGGGGTPMGSSADYYKLLRKEGLV